MRTKVIFSTIIFILCENFTSVQAQNSGIDEIAVIKAMRSITSIECLDHVRNLANDECAGRATGSEGFYVAARYIAEQFKLMNLRPTVDDSSYFQIFEVDRNEISHQTIFSFKKILPVPSGHDTIQMHYRFEEDFMPVGSSSPCNLSQRVVFAGYGITSYENNWNDYKNLCIKDKLVMVLSSTPPLEATNFGRLSRIRNKIMFAEKAGAGGLLVIGSPIGTIASRQTIPTIIISEEVADELLKGTGHTVVSIKQKIKHDQKSYNFELNHQVSLQLKSKLFIDCKTMNIIGYIQGSDPILKEEYIVLGAHADHIGTMGDFIFYGANDNASGTATLMEVAEAFGELDTPPKRSILFIAFVGEEMGLIGSKHYVENPFIPIENTKAMINLDMVGSGDDTIMVVGGKTYPEFAQFFERYSDQYIRVPIKHRWIAQNSDHYPFHEAGIPSLFLYAMNGVPTYHSTRDKPETLDGEVMESIGRLVFLVVWELANSKKISFPLVEEYER